MIPFECFAYLTNNYVSSRTRVVCFSFDVNLGRPLCSLIRRYARSATHSFEPCCVISSQFPSFLSILIVASKGVLFAYSFYLVSFISITTFNYFLYSLCSHYAELRHFFCKRFLVFKNTILKSGLNHIVAMRLAFNNVLAECQGSLRELRLIRSQLINDVQLDSTQNSPLQRPNVTSPTVVTRLGALKYHSPNYGKTTNKQNSTHCN